VKAPLVALLLVGVAVEQRSDPFERRSGPVGRVAFSEPTCVYVVPKRE
jgi:hypothetical protein